MYPPLGAFSTPVAAIYQVGELFPPRKIKKKLPVHYLLSQAS
jgi:hypothetical protein